MSQLTYVNGMCNKGYKEINSEDCPIKWSKKRKVIYLNKGDMYAMVDQHGHFVHWKHPEETQRVRGRYEEEKKVKVEGYWGETNTNNRW